MRWGRKVGGAGVGGLLNGRHDGESAGWNGGDGGPEGASRTDDGHHRGGLERWMGMSGRWWRVGAVNWVGKRIGGGSCGD